MNEIVQEFAIVFFARPNLAAISSPLFGLDCSSPTNCKKSSGKLSLVDISSGVEIAALYGGEEAFAQFGYAVAVGELNVDGDDQFPALVVR